MELTEENLRAGILVHAIKLGKCPPAGVIIGCNAKVQSLDTRTGALEDVTEKKPYEFRVTEQDLANAHQLIERECWTHAAAAKVTAIPLNKATTEGTPSVQ